MKRCRVSGFFSSADAVDEAVYRLGLLGTPRDLVEIVASKESAQRLYGKRARRGPQSQSVRLAAVGAIVGLLCGIGVSLVTVALPGWGLTRVTMAQLLGPNAATVLGALIGALIGAFRKPASDFALQRALDRDGILLVVQGCDPELAPVVRDALEESGGEDLRVET